MMMDASGIANSLEQIVGDLDAAGLEWARLDLKASQLEEDKKSFLAAIQTELTKRHPEASEKTLERLALSDPTYRAFVNGMCAARAAALQARIKYDNTEKLYDARRSQLALERVKVERNISHIGR